MMYRVHVYVHPHAQYKINSMIVLQLSNGPGQARTKFKAYECHIKAI